MRPELEKDVLCAKIENFIWSFKVYDNIKYNLKIVEKLYSYKTSEKSGYEASLYNKPLIIIYTSIIEAVFHDFCLRLSRSTTHFPKSIPVSKRAMIQNEIRAKNYSMSQLIEILKRYELFGKRDSKIYLALGSLSKLRNRIHIINWFNNFERDEHLVFSAKRLEITEAILLFIIDYMNNNYPRPWASNSANPA